MIWGGQREGLVGGLGRQNHRICQRNQTQMKDQVCIDGGPVSPSSRSVFVHNLGLNNCKHLKQKHLHYDKFNCKCNYRFTAF